MLNFSFTRTYKRSGDKFQIIYGCLKIFLKILRSDHVIKVRKKERKKERKNNKHQ